jgi:tetratricopeptide (TPR) repeat protein
MALHSERLNNRPFFSGKRRHSNAREAHFQHPPVSTDKKSPSSLREHVAAILGKLSIPLGMLIIVLCIALWVSSGYVLGKFSPEYMVTVQPFEISPEVGKSSSLSGKSASDLVVDILNDAASHAAQFHGTDYYNYVGTGAQPVSLHQAIRVPIQTTYGIEVKGISLDNIMHLYERERYEQWVIGGDVVSSPEGLVGRIRLNKPDSARSWETPASATASPSELVREATYMMLKSVAPELLGQSYLQQAEYSKAEKVFRQWAIDDPQNWKGSYYLSLAYGYQDKAQEASNLASWSQNILLDEANKSSKNRRREPTGSEKEITSNLAETTKVALVTRDTSDAQNAVSRLQQAILQLDGRFRSKPTNADYWIQRAKVLDKEALLELDGKSPEAYERSGQAIESLDRAIRCVPENGGLHEQRAILLMHLVDIMKKQRKGLEEINAREIDEAKEYTRALELRPQEDSALWGAVYARIDLENYEGAVDLARTITLLQPDSKAASTAYIVALERSIKTPGTAPERDREVKDRVKRLLQSNPDEGQMSAVWDAFAINNDSEGLELVAAGAKRLFPGHSTFEERLLHYDGQTGD